MEAKGTAVATIPAFVKSKYGEEGFQQWLGALSPETREAMYGPIMVSSWYPVRQMLVEPTRAICDLFYGGSMEGAVEQGRFSAEKGLSGVYRLFVRVSTPEFIIARAGQIMATYYRPASITVPEHSSGRAVVRITEFPEPFTEVEHRMMGWMEQALTICGVKSVQSKIETSMTTGAPNTEFHLSWK